MEEQIHQTVRCLKRQYTFFWILPVLLVIAGEIDLLPVGTWVGDVRTTYFFETLGILLVAVCVPVSLKLFSWVLVRKADSLTLPVALKRYTQWSCVRLGLLLLAAIPSFIGYYLTMHSTGALCGLIALTASLFCIPSEGRLRRELHINE